MGPTLRVESIGALASPRTRLYQYTYFKFKDCHMVDFIRKRLQVFVSSTFSDLKSERQAAVEAILTAGHIPAGMELFTSGDESQMEVIKQWIDESDVFLLILGGCYGSIEPTSKKSYIQLEYEYAVKKSKPIFACAIYESALEERVKKVGSKALETNNPSQLKEFRKLVLSKMVRFWADKKDIKIAVGETLSQFARREDLIGWVRPQKEANMPALADEIVRLSKENAELRAELKNQRPEHDFAGLNFSEFFSLLEEEDLLEFLRLRREELVTLNNFPDHTDQTKLNKLSLYGLVVKSFDNEYKLTDAGKRFLNRLTIMQIENSELDEDEA